MKYWLRKRIYIIPIICICTSFLNAKFQFSQEDAIIFGNITGFSLLTNVLMFYLFWLSGIKFCWITKFCVIGLILINLINLTRLIFEFEIYFLLYKCIIVFLIVFLSIIYKAK